MLQDIRYSFRVLFKSPGFTAIAVISLALGIGANTAIFSMVSSLLLSPLPVEDPRGLVSIFTTDTKNEGPLPVSHYNYLDYRDQNSVFSGILAYNFATVNLSREAGESRQLVAELVSGNYFDVLGVKPILGRTFFPDEDKTPGAYPVAVLSFACWQRDFGADHSIVGKTISLNRRDFTVIGVAPEGFTGTDLGAGPDVWAPMMMHNELQQDLAMFYDNRRGLAFLLIGRLKPGVSLPQAQAEISAIAGRLEREYPTDNEGRSVKLIPLLEARTDPTGDGELSKSFAILMTIVGIVLLIACVNVTNLLLARATKRRREIAIRLAIGASRSRLIRQLMTESLVLSFLGGLVGLLAAFYTRKLIASLLPFGAGPMAVMPEIDWKVLAFAAGVSLVSGLLFGSAPALQASRPELVPALKGEVTMPIGTSVLRFGLRKVLVTLQVALSLFALITAGLFVRSLQKAMQVDPGFNAENVVLLGFNLGREGYTEAQGKQFQKRLLERVSAVAGVRSATISRDRPVGFGVSRSVFVEGQDPGPSGRGVLVQTNDIGPRFFETLGIPLLHGRDFLETDDEKSPQVVIINDAMARRFWPGDDALGKRFKFFGDQEYRQVVGVARDSKVTSLVEKQNPFVYIPFTQEYSPQLNLQVRTVGDPQNIVAVLRSEIRQIDPNLTILNVQTLTDRVDQSLRGQRSQATLLGSAGLLALLLASVGVYGVMAYSVAQRTREIGIRMALGAGPGQVLKLVLGQGAVLVASGVGVGLIAAFSLTRVVAGSLFGVAAVDPITFGATSLLLVLVSLFATYVPARRATRVDPLIALKFE
jgi:predicted permease